jgi:hypothetical protein
MATQQLRYGFALATWLAITLLTVFGVLHHAFTHTQALMP